MNPEPEFTREQRDIQRRLRQARPAKLGEGFQSRVSKALFPMQNRETSNLSWLPYALTAASILLIGGLGLLSFDLGKAPGKEKVTASENDIGSAALCLYGGRDANGKGLFFLRADGKSQTLSVSEGEIIFGHRIEKLTRASAVLKECSAGQMVVKSATGDLDSTPK